MLLLIPPEIIRKPGLMMFSWEVALSKNVINILNINCTRTDLRVQSTVREVISSAIGRSSGNIEYNRILLKI